MSNVNPLGGMALPADIAAMVRAQQAAQQGPSVEEQVRTVVVQVAISTFNVEHNDEKLTDESLIRRANIIERYVRNGAQTTQNDMNNLVTEDVVTEDQLIGVADSGFIVP